MLLIKYILIGNTLPNRLQSYNIFLYHANIGNLITHLFLRMYILFHTFASNYEKPTKILLRSGTLFCSTKQQRYSIVAND